LQHRRDNTILPAESASAARIRVGAGIIAAPLLTCNHIPVSNGVILVLGVGAAHVIGLVTSSARLFDSALLILFPEATLSASPMGARDDRGINQFSARPE
jgi:hypothetical protein